MKDRPTSLRPGRGRRPAGEVRAAVLKAAADRLFESGFAAITFDKVAAQAGTSKMTLYKWWPSPGALAYEAYSSVVDDVVSFEDTGDISADLKTQLRSFVSLLTAERSGHIVAELIGAAQSDPALADEFIRSYAGPRRTRMVGRLQAARRVGQIANGIDLDVVIDELWGACYLRLLLPTLPLDFDFVDALVDNVTAGISPPRR
ncbi:TetR/AcrR family transcriptional regulator C-terminal ligand-binding domain-containing protein [Rhodococcus sp. BP-252]|uniref:TetR family transcriptional regulator n=1 Tax=Rhodococcoides kyotonense TaxID=398843 RepID=A0A177Y7Q2_9NOCA|nr:MULTISPECIES: TetR/AcrR family transcriptional regulator [Rhodococcus]NIL76412.1 putative HTH-type transcriptional regulator [Rhodococcus sp. B10]MBY6413452.1 TetR/AcrR family transcriptional regulator C-terminal ligand-binding domain-containing protein [Rhodococcus sp. BP-320]MBY6418146.1 TetR/AcrR family transcriptional regulator C-terminal ligand-binding domain-containing protein [Rhodococcus sp. BP-321]MBY6422373.1 TetR/AcrR family transcriptional regulator C-terminal ligand-binding doma